jgi:hypothetical protein
MSDEKPFVQRRREKDFTVESAKSKRASAVKPSQRKAIHRALEFGPNVLPSGERERTIAGDKRDKSRKA